jgi:hypothetical protein
MPDPENDAVQRDEETEEMAREICMRWRARFGNLMLALPPRAAARMARDALVAAKVLDRVRERHGPPAHPMSAHFPPGRMRRLGSRGRGIGV